MVFAIAVLNHLELPVVREEIRTMLRKNGRFIFSEPIRFSRTLNLLRTFFPARDEISSHKHPAREGFVRQELLDQIVWAEVIRLLEEPALIQQELDRRLVAARSCDPTPRTSESRLGNPASKP